MIVTHKLLDCNEMIVTHKLFDCNARMITHKLLDCSFEVIRSILYGLSTFPISFFGTFSLYFVYFFFSERKQSFIAWTNKTKVQRLVSEKW